MPPPSKRALVKSIQQCYEQERCTLLLDLESMRKQCLKKDQDAQKLAAITSQHTLQLKREIAALQKSLTSIAKESQELREKYSHTSSLLETAMDQHEKDKHWIVELTERNRNIYLGQQEALEIVNNQNALPVKEAHREKYRLRERVDNLRLQLDEERKELRHVRATLSDKLEKSELRVKVLDKQINESQHREKVSHKMKEKAVGEASEYERKLLLLSDEVNIALHSNKEMQMRHLEAAMEKQKALDQEVCSHRQTSECQQMAQEEGRMWRYAYHLAKTQKSQCIETIEEFRHQQKRALLRKNERITELEAKLEENQMTCRCCTKSQEKCEKDERMLADKARGEIKMELQVELQKENWTQYQQLIDKYMNMCQQLEALSNDFDGLIHEKNTLTIELEQRRKQEDYYLQQVARAQQQLTRSEERSCTILDGHRQQEKAVQSLLLKVDSLTTLTQTQFQRIQELDNGKSLTIAQSQESIQALLSERDAICHEKETYQTRLSALECNLEALSAERDAIRTEKEIAETRENSLRGEVEALSEERNALMAEKEALEIAHRGEIESYKVKQQQNLEQMKDLIAVQQRSEFFLEERKQTIEQLLEAKDLLQQQVAVAKAAIVGDEMLTQKHRLRKIHHIQESSVSEWREKMIKVRQKYKKRIAFLQKQLNALESKIKDLEQLLRDQAQTIHELTLQEEYSEFSDDPIDFASSYSRTSSAYPFSSSQ